MMIKTVIFDLGKVLLDYSFDNTYKYWSEKSGTPIEVLKTNFSTNKQYKQHEIGNLSIEQYHQHLCDSLTMNISLEDFIIGWNAMFIGLYPRTISILNQIDNKVQKVLLSNTNKTHTIFLRKNYKDLFDHLDIVFFSNEIQRRKPNNETFVYVLNTCGVRPDEALFFDDLEENIIGSKEVNINSVLVNDPNIIENDLRNYHIL